VGPNGTIAQMKNREQYEIRHEREPRSREAGLSGR